MFNQSSYKSLQGKKYSKLKFSFSQVSDHGKCVCHFEGWHQDQENLDTFNVGKKNVEKEIENTWDMSKFKIRLKVCMKSMILSGKLRSLDCLHNNHLGSTNHSTNPITLSKILYSKDQDIFSG